MSLPSRLYTRPSRLRVAVRSVYEPALDVLWGMCHPSMKRCPECRIEWEPRETINREGCCHDCAGNHLMEDWT